MISLILLEDPNLKKDAVETVSLSNAKHLVVGTVPPDLCSGVVVHVAANTADDLNKALLEFAQQLNIKRISSLMICNSEVAPCPDRSS